MKTIRNFSSFLKCSFFQAGFEPFLLPSTSQSSVACKQMRRFTEGQHLMFSILSQLTAEWRKELLQHNSSPQSSLFTSLCVTGELFFTIREMTHCFFSLSSFHEAQQKNLTTMSGPLLAISAPISTRCNSADWNLGLHILRKSQCTYCSKNFKYNVIRNKVVNANICE